MGEIKKIVLVDLCDTLYPCNTTIGFINWISGNKHKKILSSVIIKCISRLIYSLTKFDLIRFIYIKKINGYSRKDLVDLAGAYIESLVPNELIIDIVNDYKRKGYCIYIISASLDVIVESATNKLNYSGFKASELNYIDGKATGKLRNDLLGNKNILIKKFKEDCDELIFITDNFSDSNCIDLCNEFYAVIPRNKRTTFWNSKQINIIEL